MAKQNTPIQRPPEVLAWVDRNIYYDPNAGNVHKYWHKQICDCRLPSGYIVVGMSIKYGNKWKTYNLLAHHIAWYKTHGVWPTQMINHKNGKRDDNRLVNLETTTQSQNIARGGLGRHKSIRTPKGVIYRERLKSKPYEAKITKDGKTYYLGCYATAEEAYKVYLGKFKELYGFEYTEPLYSNVDYEGVDEDKIVVHFPID